MMVVKEEFNKNIQWTFFLICCKNVVKYLHKYYISFIQIGLFSLFTAHILCFILKKFLTRSK